MDNGKLGTINFNNMIPVNECNIIFIDLKKKYLEKNERNYQKLLISQIYWLNRNNEKLYNRSKKLYNDYVNGKLSKKISERCCDFKLLEKKCIEYNK